MARIDSPISASSPSLAQNRGGEVVVTIGKAGGGSGGWRLEEVV